LGKDVSANLELSGHLRIDKNGEAEVVIRAKDEEISNRVAALGVALDLLRDDLVDRGQTTMEVDRAEFSLQLSDPRDLAAVVSALRTIDLVGKIQGQIVDVYLQNRVIGNLSDPDIIDGRRSPPSIPFKALLRAEVAVDALADALSGPKGEPLVRTLGELLGDLRNPSSTLSATKRDTALMNAEELSEAVSGGYATSSRISEIVQKHLDRAMELQLRATVKVEE
jgi:hypothetical protein